MKKKCHTVNAYFANEFAENIKYVCKQEEVSISRFMCRVFDDFIDKFDACEDKDGMLRKFRVKDICSSSRYDNRKGVGICLDDERYNRIKEICEKRDTAISEVFRVLAKEYMEENPKMNNLAPFHIANAGKQTFQMYIDLN